MARPVSGSKPGLFGSGGTRNGGVSRFNSMSEADLNPYGAGSAAIKTGSALKLNLKKQALNL